MKKRSIALSMAALPLIVGCGGGGSTDAVTNTATTTPTATVTGTVPGTLIEAFCQDGSYYKVNSTNNGTSRHPFSMKIPAGLNCRLVMTTNENDPANRVITPIGFIENGSSGLTLSLNGDINLDYVPLAMDPNNITDANNDHVSDDPLFIDITNSSTANVNSTPVMDSNGNGIVDPYEDSDNNGIPNAYEDSNQNGIPDIHDDEDHNGIPDMVESHSGEHDEGNDHNDENDHDDDSYDSNSTTGGGYTDTNGTTGGATGGGTSGGTGTGTTTSNGYMLTAWNDLGMHCMDGNDFSIWSVLPPYNNLHAQIKDKNGGLVTSGVILTYEATTGTDGKINTSSSDKTNFWQYSNTLFPNSNLQPDVGLAGNSTPSTTPHELTYDTQEKWWKAEGLPLTPYNDDGTKNYYPLVKVTAKDMQGNILATAKVVLPVSDEMDCKRCHASDSLSPKAKPAAGWVYNTDPEKDFKLNVLRLHDERMPNAVADNLSALQAKGYDYNASGLEATANNGTPILCAACHSSNALPGTGVAGVKPFTQAIHSYHANVIDPFTNLKMNDSTNRNSCYACHPGSSTKCLRGAMGDAKDTAGNNIMQCQSCHGQMSHVGSATRQGWFDEPNCQACHHDGQRETSAIDPTTNTLRNVVDTRFATLPDTPVQGVSLYRFSTGHGKLQCEACHGATHAIYPAHTADNLLSQGIQGHAGTIGECTACHTTVPNTVTGGPHGMHPVGQSWVKGHEHAAENNPTQCKVCHGQDYRGSALSETWAARSFSTEWGQKNFAKDHQVSCYDCHNGPGGD